MSEVVVVGDQDTVTGFRLAGVDNTHVHQGEAETREFVRSAVDRDAGIVVITQSVAEEIRGYLDRVRRERALVSPVFVEIPDRAGPRGEDRLQQLIKRVLGTEVSLESIE